MVDKILIGVLSVVLIAVSAAATYEKVTLDETVRQLQATKMTCGGVDKASIISPGFKHRPLRG